MEIQIDMSVEQSILGLFIEDLMAAFSEKGQDSFTGDEILNVVVSAMDASLKRMLAMKKAYTERLLAESVKTEAEKNARAAGSRRKGEPRKTS